MYKKKGFIYILVLILTVWFCKVQVFAITPEEIANPVRDAESHKRRKSGEDESLFHKIRFNYVYFGSYPQREIRGSELTDAIRNGAYDANGDAVIDGKKYRRLTWEMKTTTGNFNQTPQSSWMEKSDNGYRYFLYEPIKWRILQNEGNVLFLMSDNIIDQQPMYSWTAYDKSWETFELRVWLNYDGTTEWTLPKQYKTKGFYQFAFDEEQQQRIQTTRVEQDYNPIYTDDNGEYLGGGPDTYDKIFLLSNAEITSEEYGFCITRYEGWEGPGTIRRPNKDTECFAAAVGHTVYACALGPKDSDEYYNASSINMDCWLRTCGYAKKACMRFSDDGGSIHPYGEIVNYECGGIVPALKAVYQLSDCYKVTFETNGAGTIEPQILLGSNYAKEPEELTKAGYIFTGWYTDAACTNLYEFNKKLTKDTTLYAGWITPEEQKRLEEEKKRREEIQEQFQVSEETAGKIDQFLQGNPIPADTLAVTDETILTTTNDNDIKGSTFGILQARAVKTTSKTIKLKWNKVANADGYLIYGNKCGKKNKYEPIKTVQDNKTTTFTPKKLKKGTYYKYIVRAYKEFDGKKITVAVSKTVHAATTGGKFGNAKSVKVNKTKVTLNLNKKKKNKYTLKAKEVKQSKKIKKHRAIAYESSNPEVATVSKKGVIQAKKKGSCSIYAYAQNGVYKKIKVTVK